MVFEINDIIHGEIKETLESTYPEIQFNYRPVPISRVKDTLQNNEIDLYLTMFKTKQREQEFYFSNEPISYVHSFICKKEDWKREEKLNFNNKVVIFYKGTLEKEKFFSNPKSIKVPLTGSHYNSRAIKMIERNRADYSYLYANDSIHSFLIESHPTIQCRKLSESKLPLYIVSKKKDVIDTINQRKFSNISGKSKKVSQN